MPETMNYDVINAYKRHTYQAKFKSGQRRLASFEYYLATEFKRRKSWYLEKNTAILYYDQLLLNGEGSVMMTSGN